MAKTKSIQPQTLPKSASKAQKSKRSKPETKKTEPTQEPLAKKVDEGSGSDSEEDEDSDEDDIDEAGMKRIIELLGDDGLDEFAQYQLGVLGEQGSEEEDDEIGSEGEGSYAQEDAGSENEVTNKPISSSKGGEDVGDDEDEAIAVTQHTLDAEIDLEDLSEVGEDAVPRQRLEYINTDALDRLRENIKLDANFPWTETLIVTYPEALEVDVNDDLQRELAFYKQALHSANEARSLAAKHQLPFTRPADYFAEMVKSDSHMERIRQRLLDETANIKKSEEAKRQREGKKFGKQVQQEKLKDRVQNKKEMEERIKGLKRKRKDTLDGAKGADDKFDIELEDALQDRPSKRHAGTSKDGKPRPSLPRAKRDAKFGFGAQVGRRAKQNTKESTDDIFRGGGRGKGRPGSGKPGGFQKFGKPSGGGSKRLGKSRRMAQRGK